VACETEGSSHSSEILTLAAEQQQQPCASYQSCYETIDITAAATD
jgi:hypothetical protein